MVRSLRYFNILFSTVLLSDINPFPQCFDAKICFKFCVSPILTLCFYESVIFSDVVFSILRLFNSVALTNKCIFFLSFLNMRECRNLLTTATFIKADFVHKAGY